MRSGQARVPATSLSPPFWTSCPSLSSFVGTVWKMVDIFFIAKTLGKKNNK
jgi:hypothetical protein